MLKLKRWLDRKPQDVTMKKTLSILLGAAFGLAMTANADLLGPEAVAIGTPTQENYEDIYLTKLGTEPDFYLKMEWKGEGWIAEEGGDVWVADHVTFAGNLLTWDFEGTGYGLGMVAVKGGNDNGHVNIYTVSLDQFIAGSGTIATPTGQGVSHFVLMGNGAPVPDGGVMLLLVGLAASGLGLIRKRQ